MSKVLFGIGNPLLDISANVSDDLIKQYNLKENDAILAEEKHMPLYDELVKKYDVSYIPGGATQNAIKITQWILKKPHSTIFSGCIKDDKYGRILNDSCQKIGVLTAYQYNEGPEPTGLCACLINGVHRSLVTNLGASAKFDISHIKKPEVAKLIEQAQFYYISSFFITSSHESLIDIAKHSLQNNKTFCLNLGAMFLIEFFNDQVMEAISYSDYVFGNETEALKLAEKKNFNTNDIKEIAKKISELPYKAGDKKKRTVVITQGCEPTIVVTNGVVKTYEVKKLPVKDIVDTNGAGDAFVGGFLAQLVSGKSIDDCVKCGSKTSLLIIQRSGCTFPDKVPDDLLS